MADLKKLGENIQMLRKARGYSINKLSMVSQITVGHLSRLENAKQENPTIDTLEKLANALGVTLNELLKGTGYSIEEKIDVDDAVIKVYLDNKEEFSEDNKEEIIRFIEFVRQNKARKK